MKPFVRIIFIGVLSGAFFVPHGICDEGTVRSHMSEAGVRVELVYNEAGYMVRSSLIPPNIYKLMLHLESKIENLGVAPNIISIAIAFYPKEKVEEDGFFVGAAVHFHDDDQFWRIVPYDYELSPSDFLSSQVTKLISGKPVVEGRVQTGHK